GQGGPGPGGWARELEGWARELGRSPREPNGWARELGRSPRELDGRARELDGSSLAEDHGATQPYRRPEPLSRTSPESAHFGFLREVLGEAVEHLEPARIGAGALRELFRNGLVQGELG